jgi:uncharacterized membrane protein YhhN
MSTSQRLLRGFIIFGIMYSMLLATEYYFITKYLKPFLVPFLFFAVQRSQSFVSKKWLLAALLFSWIGDCVLLFADLGELFFIVGLVAFLIAHILFIILFMKINTVKRNLNTPVFWVGILSITIYLAKILSVLLPTLGNLKIPVSIYALTISVMLVTALRGAFMWQNKSKYTVLIGAIFFVTSDSILAIDKFYEPISLATFWIMLTYLIAQFCITYGILKITINNPLK